MVYRLFIAYIIDGGRFSADTARKGGEWFRAGDAHSAQRHLIRHSARLHRTQRHRLIANCYLQVYVITDDCMETDTCVSSSNAIAMITFADPVSINEVAAK